jgi:hypothetical protein
MNRVFLAVVALAVLAVAVPAGAQYYMEYQGMSTHVPTRSLPGDCSTWHELYPNFCLPHHQDGYTDNGDGVVSACDNITLDGVTYHVDWAGPTYILEGPGGSSYWEPVGSVGTDPVCSTWHQVHPNFCMIGHVDVWEDTDQSGTVTTCDYVTVGGITYHVVSVELDIQISVTSPVDQASWGRIKSLFSTF